MKPGVPVKARHLHKQPSFFQVVPAQAGTPLFFPESRRDSGVPAFAGTTGYASLRQHFETFAVTEFLSLQ